MTALPVMVAVPQKFHVKAMNGATEIPVTTQMVFTPSDPAKVAVVATGLQDFTATPLAANSDGSSAPVTVAASLPASAVYGAGSGSQDLVVAVIPINALVFAPVA